MPNNNYPHNNNHGVMEVSLYQDRYSQAMESQGKSWNYILVIYGKSWKLISSHRNIRKSQINEYFVKNVFEFIYLFLSH